MIDTAEVQSLASVVLLSLVANFLVNSSNDVPASDRKESRRRERKKMKYGGESELSFTMTKDLAIIISLNHGSHKSQKS